MDVGEKPAEPEKVAFKELKNYHKERYMRRNKEHSKSPDEVADTADKPAVKLPSNVTEIVDEIKDVDLRVFPGDSGPATILQKRPSTELLENKPKKSKIDKFDILFGNEDVDLRQLPQVEEVCAPPPPCISEDPKPVVVNNVDKKVTPVLSPRRKDWNEVKEKIDDKKTPSKLDLVRAKLAEATKGKDGLGRPLLFSKLPSVERERRITQNEDIDLRVDNAEDHKKTISIIMSQAKEQFTDGQLDKNQYNTLMYQVLQLNEKLKLKEAKQRESLEISKRKLKAHLDESQKVISPKSSPNSHNSFGDIDERIPPPVFMGTSPNSQHQPFLQDSDMRRAPHNDVVSNDMHPNDISLHPNDLLDGPPLPRVSGPPGPSIFPGPFPRQMWMGHRPRMEDFGPRRPRGPPGSFFRGKMDRMPRPAFDPRMALPLPAPLLGMCQGECPLRPYERVAPPPPLGTPGIRIPSTDFKILEYINQDPVKTIQIDNIPREIRFYGDTAIIMLDWDDPREIKFMAGSRRVTFDNKDSVMVSFNEGYKQVEIDDQIFDIRFGAPTRELYINGRWFECFFGGQPFGVMIDGKPRLIHLEGPLPQVDILKTKRTDLVAGKINLIVDATQMCPIFLDAKVQTFMIDGQVFTIRFVDALRTALINEQPFAVEFGGLPKPIFIGNQKHFIRFSVLPRHVKAGFVQIANMEGSMLPTPVSPPMPVDNVLSPHIDSEVKRPNKTPSPEGENQGLDMLASLMPSSTAEASASEYSLAEPLFGKTEKIPGLETPSEEKPALLPSLGNINVNDLFAKLVATGIVTLPPEPKKELKEQPKEEKYKKEDKNVIHEVDLLKPETLRVKQWGVISRLYGGMQCSGCGTRFPPEHTVRYSQHLDWHFRQNRRDRDSARKAHSRHWHYDLSDWVQYEEIEDLEEREKSWFESGGAERPSGVENVHVETPSVPAGAPTDHFCALCGDKFQQFYNEDQEEWHLRSAVQHEGQNYHPLCFDDYKASLMKAEASQESQETSSELAPVDKVEEAIEIKDTDEVLDQSDNESVVEVVEPEEKIPETLEIDEGDEDDVVFKAEPIVEVCVDDADTDDETQATRQERDKQVEIDFSKVKIKQEPIDPDDEPVITAEEEVTRASVDTSHTNVISSIDGNLQLDSAPATTRQLTGIRINISKTIPAFLTPPQNDKALEDISADDEPLPPGEEPELVYTLKPNLEGIQFSRQPPVQKGNELSGLCSIM